MDVREIVVEVKIDDVMRIRRDVGERKGLFSDGQKVLPSTKRYKAGKVVYDSETVAYLMNQDARIVCECHKDVFYGICQGSKNRDNGRMVYVKCDSKQRGLKPFCDFLSVVTVSKEWRAKYASEFSSLRVDGSKSELRQSGEGKGKLKRSFDQMEQ